MTATLPCPIGFYCPSKEQQDTNELTYNKIPCEPGTYRDTEGAEALGVSAVLIVRTVWRVLLVKLVPFTE